MNVPGWALFLFAFFGMGFVLLGPELPVWNFVILLFALAIVLTIFMVIWFLTREWLTGIGVMRSETISEAMNAAGHDGRPRTFVLKDGSRYSGMFRDPNGHIIVTDIQPRNVARVEYPEG